MPRFTVTALSSEFLRRCWPFTQEIHLLKIPEDLDAGLGLKLMFDFLMLNLNYVVKLHSTLTPSPVLGHSPLAPSPVPGHSFLHLSQDTPSFTCPGTLTASPVPVHSSPHPILTLIRGCGFESRLRQELSTTEVRPLSKEPNPQLLSGRCSVGCQLFQVCMHLDGLNAEKTFHCWLYSV